jgi:hypothetical protein
MDGASSAIHLGKGSGKREFSRGGKMENRMVFQERAMMDGRYDQP